MGIMSHYRYCFLITLMVKVFLTVIYSLLMKQYHAPSCIRVRTVLYILNAISPVWYSLTYCICLSLSNTDRLTILPTRFSNYFNILVKFSTDIEGHLWLARYSWRLVGSFPNSSCHMVMCPLTRHPNWLPICASLYRCVHVCKCKYGSSLKQFGWSVWS